MTKTPQQEVDDWNMRHAVGAAVIVKLDSGETETTTTRSTAWVLSGHSAVILLTGITGCYRLDRIKPARSQGARR